MANTIKIKRGLSADISKLTLSPGELAVTLDTREMYVGDSDGVVKSISSNLKYGGVTAGTTTAYTATTDKSIRLVEGEVIALRFHANCGANPTLNINGLGAKPIYYKGAKASSGRLAANGVSILVYDTTQVTDGAWHAIFAYDSNTTYTNQGLGNGYGVCETEAGVTAKTATLSGYTLTTNGYVSIKFANAVEANSTLNINGKGAKPIFVQGVAVIDGMIEAGDTVTFVYDGTQYNLVAMDRIGGGDGGGIMLFGGSHISIDGNIISVSDLGDYRDLLTTNKDTMVNAINELVGVDQALIGGINTVQTNLDTNVNNLQAQINNFVNTGATANAVSNSLVQIDGTKVEIGTTSSKLQVVGNGETFKLQGGSNVVLQADSNQVEATTLTVSGSFNTGYHQFKKFTRGSEQRTGLFWIGEE